MIASIAGRVAHVALDHLIVEVGGVGLHVHTTPGTASQQRTGAARIALDRDYVFACCGALLQHFAPPAVTALMRASAGV